MGLIGDGYSKVKSYLERKNAEYNVAQEQAAAQDDWTTQNKGLRNIRRQVQKYRDKDEKLQLEAYLRQRMAVEDQSWVNPYGMLDNQEVNISKAKDNQIMEAPNFFALETEGVQPGSILGVENKFQSKINTNRRKTK